MKSAGGEGARQSLRPVLLLALALFLLALPSSAPALTLGVGWSGDWSANAPEMLQVGKSGASVFRMPLTPGNTWTYNDGVVGNAAENGVAIHAEVSSGVELPTGQARQDFINWVYEAVKKYGYGGEYWSNHPSTPYKPVTAWEVWNEPNAQGISATDYGQFLGEAANAIQSASESVGKRRTEVLFGGILAWGNTAAYANSVKYLEDAYPKIGSNGNVTGVAIHPYELDPESFYQPVGQPRYNRIEAFKYAVAGFHSKLVQLAEAAGSSPKSLWITESGWPAEGPQYAVGATEQATLLKQAIDYAKNNAASLNLQDFLWYNFRDAPGTSNWDNFCGLRAHDGSYRPAWTAFQEETGAAAWPPPLAVTGDATDIKETQATANGTVDPQSHQTSYRFEYGTTVSYGHSVPVPDASAGSGYGAVAVSQTLTNLQPNTHYHYRIVASSSAGTTYGVDRTFTTGVKWLIRNSNSSGVPSASFWFGLPGQVRVVGDWDGNGTETPGTYEPSTGKWRLRNSNSSGAANVEFQYGGSQYTPVVGDWDGSGTTTIGLYEPTSGTWALRNANSSGNPSISFQYGGSQFKPVVGDWDGSGTTTIGLYEPTEGRWELRNTNSSGPPSLNFTYGGSQYTPVVGDWDGSGTTTIGLYEPTAGTWALRNANGSGNSDVSFQFGGSQFTPIVGDWDGNGSVTAGLTDPNASTEREWLPRNANGSGSPSLDFSYRWPGEVAVVGDWDGNGTETPGTYEPSTGKWRLRNSNSSGAAEIEFQYGGSQFKPVVGDWDGSGTTTIGLYELTEGRWELRNTNSSGPPSLNFTYGGSQFKPVVGDWDGSGTTTIGLYEPTEGRWELRNTNSSGPPSLNFTYGGSQYTPVVGDWDGSGTTTIGLYEPTAGTWALRNANGSGNPDVSFQYGGSQYDPIAGDWDGDTIATIGLVSQ